MFKRKIEDDLVTWRDSPVRKPLILRGARQVGKTTLINHFSRHFDNYIYLNLEIKSDRDLFEQDYDIDTLVKAMHFHKDIELSSQKSTLIFIDEIQNASEAISILRYFYELKPELFVIAAGSLLESLIDVHASFPVGRVTYQFMYPMTFSEYLAALNEKEALNILNQMPLPSFPHQKLLDLFHHYALVGGFPEAVERFALNQDITAIKSVYSDLLLGYMDDVEKYARNKGMAKVIRHAIEHAPYNAGSRIKFQGFGQSQYGSREMGEALRTLEKAMLVQLVYPITSTLLPAEPNHKKSPKLQFIDTGLINFTVNLQQYYFSVSDLNSIYKGKIVEHLIGQALIANPTLSPQGKLLFWTREKPQSNAEIDFIVSFKGHLIPIEVKSGASGTLKSLNQFMTRATHRYAIRLYAGQFQIEEITMPSGDTFTLLNLPYYLIDQLDLYLEKYFTVDLI